MGIKKIVLITTGQPATNPRIVKEADALQAAGYEVTLLYNYYIAWANEADKKLLKKVSWSYQLLGGSPNGNKILFNYTRLRFKLANLFNRYLGNKCLIAERAQARAYDELLKAARNVKADWYIGHNLGALSIAVNAAKHNNAKAGFDFEDYHRGENDYITKEELSRIIYLENKYVPALDYISASSPMIADKIAVNFPEKKGKIITLLNCFPLAQQPVFREKDEHDKTLQLFWFSQTIGLNRGLEILIEAMLQMKDKNIHLTLAGRCNEGFKEYINKIALEIKDQIHFAGIINPEELPAFAAKFDVGMALELPEPENRNICLTNKVFTYLLAGNAIILSETAMQLQFNQSYQVGESFIVGNKEGLIIAIQNLMNIKLLEKQREFNYELAKNNLNWEKQSRKFINFLGNII